MKPCLINALILSLAGVFSVASHAADNNAYVRAGGGYSIVTDSKVRNVGGGAKVKFKDGYTINAAVGYRFLDIVRIELEGSYMDNTLKSFTVGGADVLRSGDLQRIAVMGNAIFDLAFTDNFYGYLGGGIGVLHSRFTADVGLGSDNSTDWSFAFQGMLGLGYNFNESISLSGGYRVLGATDPTYTISNFRARYQAPFSNIFEAGLTFRF